MTTPVDNAAAEANASLAQAAAGAFVARFDGVIAIIPSASAPFHVDGRGDRAVIGDGAPDDANCVWRADDDVLMRIFEGGRAFESAYLSGRLKISGDMSVMARLEMTSRR
jgi:hypothetical protein